MPVEHVSYAISEWQKRVPLYQLFRDYYDGNHVIKFASKHFQRDYGDLVKQLRENLCPTVVNAFTDRIAIESWAGDADTAALDEALEQGLSRLLNMVNRETFRCGDAYVLVWDGGDGTPKPRFHRADQIVPHVDPLDPDRLDWAAKVWIDDWTGRGRVNVYYPDRVEQWATQNQLRGEGFEANVSDFSDSASAWLPWSSDEDGPEVIGHQFGAVPVLWFRRDADDTTGYGRSILTDVVPLQDALNKSVADLVVLSERYADPFWYLLNHKPPAPRIDPNTGKPAEQTVKAGGRFDPLNQRIFTTDGPGPFGQLDPPDMTRLLEIQDGYALKIARVVGIPSYYLTQTSGDVPSGESLRVLSSRLNAGVLDYEQDTTPVWRGLMQLLGYPNVTPVWAPVEELDPMEKLQAAQIKQDLGYSLTDILTDLGEEDVDGILARARDEQANVGQVAVDAFRRGEDPAEALR